MARRLRLAESNQATPGVVRYRELREKIRKFGHVAAPLTIGTKRTAPVPCRYCGLVFTLVLQDDGKVTVSWPKGWDQKCYRAVSASFQLKGSHDVVKYSAGNKKTVEKYDRYGIPVTPRDAMNGRRESLTKTEGWKK